MASPLLSAIIAIVATDGKGNEVLNAQDLGLLRKLPSLVSTKAFSLE
jgi:hypothetical protein